MEAPPGIEPGMEVLQTSALPLGDGALTRTLYSTKFHNVVRESPTGLEGESYSTHLMYRSVTLNSSRCRAGDERGVGVCRMAFEWRARVEPPTPRLRRSRPAAKGRRNDARQAGAGRLGQGFGAPAEAQRPGSPPINIGAGNGIRTHSTGIQ